MARMKYKTKSIIKKIALVLAGVAALTAVAFGVKAIVDYTKNDLKTIKPSFEVGNLGNDGKYVNDESTLYTKEAFGCYGLQIKPDFDSQVNYQVFYYDILDNFISSTSMMSEGFSDEAPVNGAYARLVIEPQDDEDGKIGLFERIDYPSQLTIKVKKEQDINNRYALLDGKILDVVYDSSKVVFTNGISLVFNPLSWEIADHRCATSTTVLKVPGGWTVNFDYKKLNEKYKDSYFYVFQFSGIDLSKNALEKTQCTNGSMVLDKKTSYIIIVADAGSASTTWDASALKALPGCISITKTK